jgi:hypothetical protein
MARDTRKRTVSMLSVGFAPRCWRKRRHQFDDWSDNNVASAPLNAKVSRGTGAARRDERHAVNTCRLGRVLTRR